MTQPHPQVENGNETAQRCQVGTNEQENLPQMWEEDKAMTWSLNPSPLTCLAANLCGCLGGLVPARCQATHPQLCQGPS